jgi:tetratricopeptide (TPR) repeat protein
MIACCSAFAGENLYRQARELQREGKFDEAIETYKAYFAEPVNANDLSVRELEMHTDALVQLMNTFQSKGEPDACIEALQEVFKASRLFQHELLRDFDSVMGYALSRTEKMKEAEATMLKALALPLYSANPERYFRDYAYAAAVFYSNPDYHGEVINWCVEAIHQAQLSDNTSGKQWVTAMLGAIYKKDGDLNRALDLFLQSEEEAKARKDDLGVLNSLNSLVDLFLYWNIPEYADLYATKAVKQETDMRIKNPMVLGQTYINKGRALHQLGKMDSILFYTDQAKMICRSLPYNSGMVDVNLLEGIYMTEKGGDSLEPGIQQLQNVIREGTATNRAKAYHQLAQTYLKMNQTKKAGIMLDSLHTFLKQNDSPVSVLHIDYKPILDHYVKMDNREMVDQYVQMILKEQKGLKENRINTELVGAIVDFQTEETLKEIEILQLKETNKRLWLMNYLAIAVIVIILAVVFILYEKRKHHQQMKKADEKVEYLVEKLNESNVEKDKMAQEIEDFLKDTDRRQELETLTPHILKESGETKFRQCFELLYPLFLHRLRDKVPSVTRREEVLSMLIVLKQDNKKIAEYLAIAPRSVLMLRHRFRQKIGMDTEYSLENFIDDLLR